MLFYIFMHIHVFYIRLRAFIFTFLVYLFILKQIGESNLDSPIHINILSEF